MYALYSMYMFYVHKFALNIFLRFKEKAWSLNFLIFFIFKKWWSSLTIWLSWKVAL